MPLKETATISILSPSALFMNALYVPLIYFLNTFGENIIVLIFLMFIDFLTGFMKSRKLCTPINRYKFEIGLYVKLFTLFFIFSFALVIKMTGFNDIDILIKTLINVFIGIEIYSIIGNGIALKTGKVPQDKDLFSFILLAIRSKIEEEIIKRFGIKDKGDKDESK